MIIKQTEKEREKERTVRLRDLNQILMKLGARKVAWGGGAEGLESDGEMISLKGEVVFGASAEYPRGYDISSTSSK